MKKFTPEHFAEVKDGWYWSQQYKGGPLVVIPVFWREHREHGKCLRLDYGYCCEADIVLGKPDAGYYHTSDFPVLFGPLEVPEEEFKQ